MGGREQPVADRVKGALDVVRREPVMALALVQAVIVCGVAFGLELTDGQTAAVLGVTAAVLALVARSRVTPTTRPPADR